MTPLHWTFAFSFIAGFLMAQRDVWAKILKDDDEREER